jgi:RNA polymerase primary sigma factor
MGTSKLHDDNDGLLQSYFEQIKQIPLLDFEDELELSNRIQKGDKAARKRLTEANLRLVIKIARSYLSRDVSLMDLIQEGNLGLMKAVERYDYKRNVRFSTYAGWWIRQSIMRYLTNRRRAIRLPHRKEEIFRKVQRAYNTLSQIYMRQPRMEEIAGEIGVPLEEVEFVVNMTNGYLSLEPGGRDDAFNAMDLHEDYTYNPERALMRKTTKAAAIHAVNRLKDRDRRVLSYRYQLNGSDHFTLKKISAKMGLSPETVRQIEIKALLKMRLQNDELKGFYQEAM